jgi:uridine phosphorylase
MGWPFDTSEPYVTPAADSEYRRQRLGITPEAWQLPPTLVATFQRQAHERLLERIGVGSGTRSARENSRGAGPIIGTVAGVSVAVARITVGAPAAAMVLEEAIARGVRNILVVGGAGSLQPTLPRGTAVIVEGAEREDGTSHHYLPAGEAVGPEAGLSALLEGAAIARGVMPVRGRSWTTDAPYRETVGAIRRHREAGVSVVEMEAAAIFAVAQVRRVCAALIVAVWDELFGERLDLP